MKPKFLLSLASFISAYSPLLIIWLIFNFDFKESYYMKKPFLTLGITILFIISWFVLYCGVKGLKKGNGQRIKVKNVSKTSGELMNYSIPYIIPFAFSLEDVRRLLAFGVFMIVMFVLTIKTHNILINPILTIFGGYNLYIIEYELNKKEYKYFFLCREIPKINGFYRMEKISFFLNFIIKPTI